MTDELCEWEQSLQGDKHEDREFPLDELHQDDPDGEQDGRR